VRLKLILCGVYTKKIKIVLLIIVLLIKVRPIDPFKGRLKHDEAIEYEWYR
jgi:hypothetical protein